MAYGSLEKYHNPGVCVVMEPMYTGVHAVNPKEREQEHQF